MSYKENGKLGAENSVFKKEKKIIIAGVEGGATRSILVVLDENGNKLTEVDGLGTNHWVIGNNETTCRINDMIVKAKQQLNMSNDIPFDCVGLCLSGGEEEETNNILVETMIENYPLAAKEYIVGPDTLGSLKTGLPHGGIVLIAGTGSNALLINPDGEKHNCGGWGHVIGDEGGAFWIALKACKYVFDDIDDLTKAPFPIAYVFKTMKSFFQVDDRHAMLRHLYADFDKSKIAMFTKELAKGCEKLDRLCLFLFEDAGRMLAKHVEAISSKAHNDLKNAPGGLKIICVGSVWKSWNYMKNGFIGQIKKNGIVDELTLLYLTVSGAVGACYLAAEKLNLPNVKRTYETNTTAFYHYKR